MVFKPKNHHPAVVLDFMEDFEYLGNTESKDC
jgi:hypothetical protein